MKGFFAVGQQAPKQFVGSVPLCGACGLLKTCKSPKMPVTGSGRRKLLIVGEVPGATEDSEGKQFVGKSGKLLEHTLRNLGVRMWRDCWLTNALSCRPPGNKIDDDRKIDYCRPLVINAIKELNPEIIILLGGIAVKSLIAYLWRDSDIGGIGRWAGWQIPAQQINAWVCPTFHPSYILREKEPTANIWWNRHLKAALALKGRPWESPPSYADQVERLYSPNVAAAELGLIHATGKPVAFDFETNMLKPDSRQARIVCCSVSNGLRTIAYPWVGRAIEATKRLLMDKHVAKVGANVKFETRWALARLDCRVRNWFWDTMQASHILDNRQAISSLKFQAFVQFGQPCYDEHIKPYLEGIGGNGPNRIQDVDQSDLLLYCGLDALLEWKLARKQTKQMGFAWPKSKSQKEASASV